MPDRDNIDDIYNIVKNDFNWIIEDMEQHRKLLHDELIKLVAEDNFNNEFDDFREKREDLKKLIEKIENLRREYVSIIKGEEVSKININETEYDFLEDWSDTTPKEILLLGKRYMVKSWREILLTLIDELYRIDKNLVECLVDHQELKGRKRTYFTYNSDIVDVRFYNKTSYGLYIMTNASANTIFEICRNVLRISGYDEDELKIKLDNSFEDENHVELKLDEKNKLNQENVIKLPREYSSITIGKNLLKEIIYSILNRKREYGANYIEPRKITEKFETSILSETNYTIPYHPVINIIKFLKDNNFLANYGGTKKGKYIVIDDILLKEWIENKI